MIPRLLTSRIDFYLEKYPMVAVMGPRQSGKTTLVKNLRPDFKYVNLELTENHDFATRDPHGFLQHYRGGVILDEVQSAPALFPYLKEKTDERGQAGEYILSGSQNYLLAEKITESLAGRVAITELLPFSLAELEPAGLLPDSPEKAIFMGGYPRLFDKRIPPADFFADYVKTYIERDVRQIAEVQNLSLFRQFLAICAGRVGQTVHISEMGNMVGIDAKTAAKWLSILESSFILTLLPAWHRNFNKRIVKAPKLFFYDTGLAASLLGIRREDDLLAHFARGSLFENLVFVELLKNAQALGQRPGFFFWRDSNGNEVDLIMENGLKTAAIELKSGKTLNQSFFDSLLKFGSLPDNPAQLFLVYGGDTDQPRTGITALGWRSLRQLAGPFFS